MHNADLLQHGVRPTRREGVREFSVGDELVLFATAPGDPAGHISANERAITLNASGKAIWELCDGRHSIDDILRALSSRYGDADGGLVDDLSTALARFRTLGMLEFVGADASGRRPVKIVVGIEDRTYFHWQLPILFESLLGQLPPDWDICVVVCNNHEALSEGLLQIVNTYNVKFVTGRNHPHSENIDFADGGEVYVPINRIEALAAIAGHVDNDDLVCLMDTDIFLYNDLNTEIFPDNNALSSNWIVNETPFFKLAEEDLTGVDLVKLLDAMGCTTPFKPGGVSVFLTGETVRNKKFVHDCFRFTQILYLIGKIKAVPKVWVAEMPCFALALTANGISYDIIDNEEFAVSTFDRESVSPGTFYHYYHDLKDGGDGAFRHSVWHKQEYFDTDFLTSDIDRFHREAATDHERYFFELAKRGRQRLDAENAART